MSECKKEEERTFLFHHSLNKLVSSIQLSQTPTPISEHYLEIQGEGIIDVDHKHEVEFENWFKDRICGSNATNVSKELYSLACGFDALVAVYQGTEKVHEENEEDNGDAVYQESECIGVNATVQQENDEDSTLLHRVIPTMKKKHIVMTTFQAQIRKKIYLAMMNLLEILGMKIKLSFDAGY
nr:hypothetical protein CFP56_31444 [Quercus suber]